MMTYKQALEALERQKVQVAAGQRGNWRLLYRVARTLARQNERVQIDLDNMTAERNGWKRRFQELRDERYEMQEDTL